jgi:hypothetical protein
LLTEMRSVGSSWKLVTMNSTALVIVDARPDRIRSPADVSWVVLSQTNFIRRCKYVGRSSSSKLTLGSYIHNCSYENLGWKPYAWNLHQLAVQAEKKIRFDQSKRVYTCRLSPRVALFKPEVLRPENSFHVLMIATFEILKTLSFLHG